MPSLFISRQPKVEGKIPKLPASKSISNRAIILNALSGNLSHVSNLATARDTQLMQQLITNPSRVIDVMDAGTTMRFLTAYFAVTNQHKILTGTARMKERPIWLLVESLKKIGATIEYQEKEGFPPIEIKGFGNQREQEITIPGNISSQYISALMMVAPVLPRGLVIHLQGEIGSKPYLEMTSAMMALFGVRCKLDGDTIDIPNTSYKKAEVAVEPDWSALSYWFAIVALAREASVTLEGVNSHSIQGDRVIMDIMDRLGVRALFEHGGLVLSKKEIASDVLTWDFKDCPDLAQTVIPVCALKGIRGVFRGLESLYIKETDRVVALQNELSKVGAVFSKGSDGSFTLTPGSPPSSVKIETYHDHRMAMGFAPWATMMDVEIDNPEVVNKSYPEFWEDLRRVGLVVEY